MSCRATHMADLPNLGLSPSSMASRIAVQPEAVANGRPWANLGAIRFGRLPKDMSRIPGKRRTWPGTMALETTDGKTARPLPLPTSRRMIEYSKRYTRESDGMDAPVRRRRRRCNSTRKLGWHWLVERAGTFKLLISRRRPACATACPSSTRSVGASGRTKIIGLDDNSPPCSQRPKLDVLKVSVSLHMATQRLSLRPLLPAWNTYRLRCLVFGKTKRGETRGLAYNRM